MTRSILLVSALAALVGCVERAPELSPADRERVRQFVSTERPSPEHRLDVEFANGVSLLGYDLEPDTVVAGQPFTITWYWHARQKLDPGWRLFTHVADASGENRLNQDDVGVIRELYPPSRWKAGEYIRDVQEVTLTDWNSPRAVFYLGLWKGDHRLAIRRGDNDGDNRVRAASIDIASAPAAAARPQREARPQPDVKPPPALEVHRATGPIRIDGKLNENDWESATQTSMFVNTRTGGAAPFEASARVLWDDDYLYVAFEVQDDFVKNTIRRRDGHLWEQDAVEIMIDPDGDGRNYFELQVSPTGQIFDTRYDSRREPQPYGDVAWNSRARAKVEVRGTANDDAADEGYTAEIAIPWAAFHAGDPPATKPEAGDTWRMNFYVMDARPEGEAQRAAGWSPTHEGDFHVPSRFGRVTFRPAPSQVAETARPPKAPVLQIRPEMADLLKRDRLQGPGARIENLRQLKLQRRP